MKIIQPLKIQGEILDLIDTAKKEIVIISPYNEITGWEQTQRIIKRSQSNKVKITWYSRLNAKQKYSNELWDIFKINPILIENLHAKIYLNEKVAIVTSMNFCKASAEKSTDIGTKTENQKEYQDVYTFYETYIKDRGTCSHIEMEQEAATHGEHAKVEDIPEKISSLFYVNGIYEHLCKRFGKIEYQKRYKNRMDNDDNLKYFSLNVLEYTIDFIPYESAIKMVIHLQQTNLNMEDSLKAFKSDNVDLSSKELKYDVEEGSIKYYYKSNYCIKDWDTRRLDYFLSDVDKLLKFAFSF